jgi:hypothetical protein
MSQLRVNSIRSETGTGAVDFPNGATVTGVITATTLQSSITGDFTVSGNLNVSGIATVGSLGADLVGNITGVAGTFSNAVTVGSAISMSASAIDGGVSVRILGESLKIAGVATALDFNALSDVNLKDNVATVGGALDKVSELRGVSFNWKESGELSYGVIAQELENVLPELVHGSDPKTVNYNGIIGVLIEAVKELKAEVDSLKE